MMVESKFDVVIKKFILMMQLVMCFLVFIYSNKKVVYCLNWSIEDMTAAESQEVPMTKQIIDCLSALGEA